MSERPVRFEKPDRSGAAGYPTTQLPLPESGTLRIGVVADTHIPDRLSALPLQLFTALDGVNLILHAGDICHPKVLTELERIAPVLAVLGNRDIWYRANWNLPLDCIVEIGAVRIGLTHGHNGLWGYLREKLLYYTVGFRLETFVAAAQSQFNGVQAVVFGHSHHPFNEVRNGVLLFNPGSVGSNYRASFGASVGILTVDANSVRGEIVPLGFRAR
ncbi:MAG TPA: YfcE family phosphodiesterase [Anaerolineales bacterium]|nr:YfcE family phosphodiesterase [Anaerolineales bacterium]